MKKSIVFAALLAMSMTAFAAPKDEAPVVKFSDYKFTTVLENPITSIKDQHRSGTCWAYSAISFVESEIIRINNITDPAKYPDISEFFVVSHSYSDRASKYVRVDGALGFSAGSQCGDVFHVIEDYGMVPNSEMTGMQYGTELPVQAEMDAVLLAYVKAVNGARKPLTTAWKRGFDAVLAEYLGAYPVNFTVDGAEYTPLSYRDALGIKPADYVSITSFQHNPLYTWNLVDVCDNWRGDMAFNVTLDEMMAAIDRALENGYTVVWATDVSRTGFTRDGLAILVDEQAKDNSGSDKDHWTGPEKKDAPKKAASNKKKEFVPAAEVAEVTPELRQTLYDNKTTTDDHGMHIYGIAKDQFGKKYYMVKNSWGDKGDNKGIWYATENFVRCQTMNIVLNVNALDDSLRSKLGK